ncbi:MAG: hypothetical protein ACRDRE_14590 [Pseudonocardiaceae bacterium]
MATIRPPRPDTDLPARTMEWLAKHPHQRRFVHSVWAELVELERMGYHTGAIDALRSVLLDHQPATRAGRCRACRCFTGCKGFWNEIRRQWLFSLATRLTGLSSEGSSRAGAPNQIGR